MSNFAFLQREWFAIHDACVKAESYVNSDARAASFYGRIALEQVVAWLYRYDPNYRCYDMSLGARVHEPCFSKYASESIFTKATIVIEIGNRAAHGKSVKPNDALTQITELFHIMKGVVCAGRLWRGRRLEFGCPSMRPNAWARAAA